MRTELAAHTVVFGAASEQNLRLAAAKIATFLEKQTRVSLAEACAMLAERAAPGTFRASVTGTDRADLTRRLHELSTGNEAVSPAKTSDPGRLVFLFSGPDSAWPGMGTRLWTVSDVFRGAAEACLALFRDRGLALPDGFDPTPDTDPQHLYPLFFAYQYALARTWDHFGVRPDMVLGYSLGELAAYVVAGAVELRDAVAMVHEYGRLCCQHAGEGELLSIVAAPRELHQALGDAPWDDPTRGVSLSIHMGDSVRVVSGDPANIAALRAELRGKRIFSTKVPNVPIAAHSAGASALGEELDRRLGPIAARTPEVPLMTTQAGRLFEAGDVDERFWSRWVSTPLDFGAAIDAVLRGGPAFFLEIGPHPSVHAVVERIIEERDGAVGRASTACSARKNEELEQLFAAAGALYERGFSVRVAELFRLGAGA